ncbi:hypothetical protein [Halosimplex sp. TS25]|uniref:hypothetical protein n=1 Tax=Halosimplex rarum TaxID=3396619 RepID=UPI0039E99FB8
MATILNETLDTKVGDLEEKAERIERSKNTEQKVDRVTASIRRVNSQLIELEKAARELAFYIDVLEKVFDDSRSNCLRVENTLERVQEVANVDEEDLLDAAEDHSLEETQDDISDATDSLEETIDTVTDRIEDEYQEEWRSKLSSALELNSIIGGRNDEFSNHVRTMQTFIGQEIWKTDRQPSSLARRWNELTAEWQQRSGKHGWDAFQAEHELSDSTIEDLKQFTDDEPVRLPDLSLSTLEEIKQVSELESALQVELQTR